MAWLSRLRRRLTTIFRRPRDKRQSPLTSKANERNEHSAPHYHLHHTAPSPATSSSALVTPEHGRVNFYPNAGNISIGQQNITNMQSIGSSKTVFEYIDPHVSHGAAHDSDERCDAPKCSPETREAIQSEIVGLIEHGDISQPSKKLIWLGGPAGCGKTAIAGSVADTCKSQGLLAGSFFFSSFLGSVDRRSKRCVITTLASRLAAHDVLCEYKAQLLVAIEKNPGIFRKRLIDQAQCLILDALHQIQGRTDTSNWPRGIVLDGLDEVQAVQYHDATREDLTRNDEDDQLDILHVLLLLANSPAFPFRIIVASRPERAITDFFANVAQATTVTLFLDSKYKPDADIKRFLHSKFADIRHRSGISGPSWPGEEVIGQIVEMSSGQFIVPSTIIRYIGCGLPHRQLEDIMQVERVKNSRNNPFALLDALYAHILNRSPNPAMAVVWIRCFTSIQLSVAQMPFGSRVISSLRLAQRLPSGDEKERGDPRHVPSYFWRKFLEHTEGEFLHVLTPLASLLSIPHHNDRRSSITIYHKSLTDFLSSEVRCGQLYISDNTWLSFAGRRFVDILKGQGRPLRLFSFGGQRSFISLLSSLTHLSQSEDYSYDTVSHRFAAFLGYLRGSAAASELAVCDVAWWTHLVLTERLQSSTKYAVSTVVLGGIYCSIHSRLCGFATSDEACHPACTHWRSGILDQARHLGWCVHQLEEVPLTHLSRITIPEWEHKFKEMGPQLNGKVLKCDICQPPSNFETQATTSTVALTDSTR
ncbi:hypothetical protein NMY22_g7939 [Coprinellus aureogranulatus]|nr:hypothetical protein NMY22_g7939 [Coprinellus aureogranulatus]